MAEPLSLEDRAKRALQAITGVDSSFKEEKYNGTIIAEFSAVISKSYRVKNIHSSDMRDRLGQIKTGSNTNLVIEVKDHPLADEYRVVTSFKLDEHNVSQLEKQAKEMHVQDIIKDVKNSSLRLGMDRQELLDEVVGRIAGNKGQEQSTGTAVGQEGSGYSNSPYKITGDVPGGVPADRIDGIPAAAISGGNKHQL
ncbi:MAG: hypothetical protein R3D71_02700 [Rickettsiales bacterium]